jgi:transcriptional regulator with XRE-family HTH domain
LPSQKTVTPLEKVIRRALKKQNCTAHQLGDRVGMIQSNFSLARNSRRSMPLPVLLQIFKLADISAEEQLRILRWIAFKQVL